MKIPHTPALDRWDQPALWWRHRIVRSDNGCTPQTNLQLNWA